MRFVIVLSLFLAGCAVTGSPDNTAGAGCVEYRGRAAPGIAGAFYVRGDLTVHGCRCNATSEDLVREFAGWCAGEGEVIPVE